MNIQKINFLPGIHNTNNKQNTKQSTVTSPNNKRFPAFAYQDFNINFGERLFRTPANFYEQPFNQKGMPDSMKEYLNADYGDRQNIPPVQMMKIVFGDINEASSLEDVKELYPDEPLFQNLHSMQDKKYREGILAEIKIMQDEVTPLFKNGSNDLGLYILKKIYTEGKTLKEINKDFRKDINKEFEALSNIDYRTLQQFGIKFPNNAFWHSFIVTREDFPYTYTPRKAIESRINGEKAHKEEPSYAEINARRKVEDTRPPKFQPKDYEVKKFADALVKGHGDRNATLKELKRKFNVKDEKAQFVNKYFSEIMSIALERIHASDEMRDFFENYESLDKTQKQKMEAYWQQNPLMKELQSIAISDTIKLFFLTYGPDGNNSDFEELIEYANSIKPEREERIRRHNELQAEYEKELGIFEENTMPKANNEEINIDDEDLMSSEKLDELLEKAEQENGITSHATLHIDGDDITLVGDIKNETIALTQRIYGQFFPEKFVNKYAKFMVNHPIADERYILSYHTAGNNINIHAEKDILKKILINSTDFQIKTNQIQQDFYNKYPNEEKAAQQAILDGYYRHTDNIPSTTELYKYYPLAAVQYSDFPPLNDEKDFVNSRYDKYIQPLSAKETNKINIVLNDLLRKYNQEHSTIIYRGIEQDENRLTAIKTISLVAKSKTPIADYMKQDLYNFIKDSFGGSARVLLDKDTPNYIKEAKMEQIILDYIQSNNSKYKKIIMQYRISQDL